MAGIKLRLFSGENPKIASHLLTDSQAQETVNAKVDSGMLEAWKNNSTIENTSTVSPLTLYEYVQDDGATKDWYVSAEDLDFVDNPQSADTYERVFFAGAVNDDYYSDYVLVSGAAQDSEGTDGYDPSTGVITLTDDYGASDFAVGNYVLYDGTLYPIIAVSLNTGAGSNTLTLSSTDKPSSLSGNIGIQERLYDSPNYGEKELRFFANDIDGVNPWEGSDHYGVLGVQPPEGEPYVWVNTGDTAGRGEGTNDYSYIYTYVNSYGEEGPPSSPTTPASLNTADTVNVQVKPPAGVGDNEAMMPDDFHYDITQVKIYRTETGVTSTDFLFVKTVNIASIENVIDSDMGVDSYVPATGVITMTDAIADDGTFDPAKHHYVLDQDNGRYYRITAVSLGNGAGSETITIADAKPNTLSSDIDIVEWYTADDTDIEDLGDPIATEDYYPPITGLDGLTSMASGHLYSWKDNVLYYSFPYLPHAWKPTDVKSIDCNIIVARGFANSLCLATDGHPYVLSGQSPRTFNKIKMGEFVPCTSKRSTVTVNNAILYPAREGLIQLSVAGTQNLTRNTIRRETWISYDMANAFAMFRNNRYFGFPNNAIKAGFILDYIDGTFLTLSYAAECGYITPDEGIMYFVSVDASEGASGTRRSIKQWQGDSTSYRAYTWKSKKYILPRNVNMGVARIELDDDFYDNLIDLIDDNEYLQTLNVDLFAQLFAYDGSTELKDLAVTYADPVLTFSSQAIASGAIVPGHHRVLDPTTGYHYPITSVSLGNGAGSETVTIDTVSGAGGEDSPPAAWNSTASIIIPKDLQGAIGSGNIITRTGRTLNRHTVNGDILYDLNSINASPYVALSIWVDGTLIFQKNISTAKAFKLPRGIKGKRWEVQFSGTIPIRAFDMATTMKEILK